MRTCARRPVEIIGGGLAGLSLGIFLARRGVPVSVQEAGFYPRHRVCGEFLSPRDTSFLKKCALEKLVASCADGRASSVLWECEGRVLAQFHLRHSAWRVSRYKLDLGLAKELRNSGAQLVEGRRADVEQLKGREGVVFTTGRRRSSKRGWIGLKLHLRGFETRADLEMLCGSGAYVGVCRVGEDVTNLCALFRCECAPGGKWPVLVSLLQKHRLENVASRLHSAKAVEGSFCAVSHLDFRLPRSCREPICRLGDAFGMIAPLSGNGMSMALESAWLAHGPLVAYSESQMSWREACSSVFRKLHQAFYRRMFFSRLCQTILLCEPLRPALIASAMRGFLPWRGLHAALGR